MAKEKTKLHYYNVVFPRAGQVKKLRELEETKPMIKIAEDLNLELSPYKTLIPDLVAGEQVVAKVSLDYKVAIVVSKTTAEEAYKKLPMVEYIYSRFDDSQLLYAKYLERELQNASETFAKKAQKVRLEAKRDEIVEGNDELKLLLEKVRELEAVLGEEPTIL